MFVAQAYHQPGQQDPRLQPDFAVLAGHVTGAMEELKRIPNMPVVTHGAQFLEILQTIQSDLRKVQQDGAAMRRDINVIQHDVQQLKVNYEEVGRDVNNPQPEGADVRYTIQQIQHDVEQVKVNSDEVHRNVDQVKLDIQFIKSE